ncbi:M23 family metallopeptidase [Coprococcus catus]|uniref:M23 family metallopeptidase n=1 Tax=Coprococcus catus TaxID=116085 RepID=UPI001FEC66B0|nr:M23 family metallopeptidase [Coprococcus catus]MEE0140616.1 M23 family metallopeptidase [Coprococcus sp.]
MMSFFRKNGFYVMALVLIAGILAISGIAGYVSGQSERNQAENAAEFKDRAAGTASNEAKLAESEAAVADEMTGYNADLVQKILSMIENGTLALEDFEEEGSMNGTAEASAKDAAVAENEPAEAAEDEPEADTEEAEMAGNVLNAGYSSENVMSWPVRGEVIMDYSMDKTIYYPTLQEYKCNPSILIQSEEGTDVAAAFSGTVADVYHDAQLGTVLEMSLGNGYEAYYGQLENVDVAVGDTVRQGQIIGTVSTPTRFYSIEGSHLNFRVTRDGEPVDPLDYLD